MASIIGTRRIEKELCERGLVPEHCRLIEISMTPASALVIRYEIFVTNEQVGLVADALKAAAEGQREDDERNRRAIES